MLALMGTCASCFGASCRRMKALQAPMVGTWDGHGGYGWCRFTLSLKLFPMQVRVISQATQASLSFYPTPPTYL